jgi:hypothetical protein
VVSKNNLGVGGGGGGWGGVEVAGGEEGAYDTGMSAEAWRNRWVFKIAFEWVKLRTAT